METRIYCEACDASAAARLETSTFFAAATDEDNILRLFNRDRAGMPIQRLDVTKFLELDPEDPEADLEGAASLGPRIYWLGSHGRSRTGKKRPNRQRLFATAHEWDAYNARIRTVGKPYKHLLDDLLACEELAPFNLRQAEALAPQAEGGLNIEGLSKTPDGQLLIGFRNPIPDGRALLVRLTNPEAVVAGTERAKLRFGGHIDLDGRGIRAIEYVIAVRRYIIIAGPHDDRRDFAMFKWTGELDAPAEKLAVDELDTVVPEDMVFFGAGPRDLLIDLMSDLGEGRCGTMPVRLRTFKATTFPVRFW